MTTSPIRVAEISHGGIAEAVRTETAAAPAPAPATGRFHLRTFESLNDREFRWFYLALLGQMGAMNMQMLARGYLAFELTGSFAALGLIGLANAIPMLALSLYGGVIADRFPKKRVLQAGQAVSALIALCVGLLLVADLLTFPYLLAAGAVQGVVMALMMPSRQSILPEVIGMERLMNAVSLQAAGMNLMRLMGPAAGGFLIAWVGAEALYFIMTAMYLIAVVALGPVRLRHEGGGRARSGRARRRRHGRRPALHPQRLDDLRAAHDDLRDLDPRDALPAHAPRLRR